MSLNLIPCKNTKICWGINYTYTKTTGKNGNILNCFEKCKARDKPQMAILTLLDEEMEKVKTC